MHPPRTLVAFAAVLLAVAACQPEEAPEDPEEGPPQAAGRPDVDLIVWADDARAPLLEHAAEEFAEEQHVEILVEAFDFESLADLFTVNAPQGRGPDVLVGAHDWLGEFVELGAVASIDLGDLQADLDDLALEAFTYEGATCGLPYAVENVALVYNTDLVSEPASWDEVVDSALELMDDGAVDTGLALPAGATDPFHNYPFVTAHEGYLFAQDEDGAHDPTDLGLDEHGMVAAGRALQDWADAGLIDVDLTSDLMAERFLEGGAPYAITGPWDLARFEEAGLPYAVAPIPEIEGGTPRPFISVQGFMVSGFAESEELAQTFVVDHLGSEQVQLDLFEAERRPPAADSVRQQLPDDPAVEGFQQAGADGEPMPSIPEMGAVWGAWERAYEQILEGAEDPEVAFTRVAAEVRGLLLLDEPES